METKRYDETELQEVAEALKEGELVAFPTETVYGLGANALLPNAVKKVFSVKLNKKLQKFIFFYYICGVRILHLITIRLYAEGFQPIVSAYSVETFYIS